MMLPILISVSDAPGSYFFWAKALPQVAASTARTAAPNRQQIAVIPKFRFGFIAFSSEVGTGSHRNQVYADCVDLSAMENASNKRVEPGSDAIRTDRALACIEYVSDQRSIKSPLRLASQRADILPFIQSGYPDGNAALLGCDLAADGLADQLPLLSLEPLHLQLGDRGKIGGRGVDLDARQQRIRRKVLQARRLLHDVGAGEIVTAHFQRRRQGLGCAVTIDDTRIGLVRARHVLVEELDPFLHAGIVAPLRIGAVLGVGRRQYALGVVETGRCHDAADRGRHVGDDLQRLPAELGGLLDGLAAAI